jgi:hypothetical protein
MRSYTRVKIPNRNWRSEVVSTPQREILLDERLRGERVVREGVEWIVP